MSPLNSRAPPLLPEGIPGGWEARGFRIMWEEIGWEVRKKNIDSGKSQVRRESQWLHLCPRDMGTQSLMWVSGHTVSFQTILSFLAALGQDLGGLHTGKGGVWILLHLIKEAFKQVKPRLGNPYAGGRGWHPPAQNGVGRPDSRSTPGSRN